VPAAGVRRSVLWSLCGTALGIALLYAATRQADSQALLATLRAVVWQWAAVVLAATLAFCALKTWRWSLLLGALPRVTFRDLQAAVYVGVAVNFLVAHVGELLRATTISRRHGLPVGTVLASIVIERVLDFIAILAMLAIILVAMPDSPAMVVVAAVASAAFVAVAIAALYLLLRPPAWSERAVARLGDRLRPGLRQRITHHLARFRAGLAPLRKRRLMLVAVLISALQWGAVAAAIWFSGLAVSLSVSLLATTVTFVLIILGMTLPNSPLQIGTTQLAFVVGFGTDETGVNEAIAASLVYTAFLIVPTMLVGAAAMLRAPLGTGRRRQAGGESE
jgi:glycosyltransferase 2 family protein